MSARDNILARVRAAARTGWLPSVTTPQPDAATAHSLADRLQRFDVEARALGVECYVEESESAVLARLQQLVSDRCVLSWAPDHLPYRALAAVTDVVFGDAPRARQAVADVGLTGCDAAIAETASLVLLSGPGRGRSVSLLPPFHIALVRPDQLCFSFIEALTRLEARLHNSASCTIITGPSRTADIELTLTLGIHGPGRVAVIIGP